MNPTFPVTHGPCPRRLRLAFLLIALAAALYFIQSRFPLHSHRHTAGPTITYRHTTPAISYLALPPTLTLTTANLGIIPRHPPFHHS